MDELKEVAVYLGVILLFVLFGVVLKVLPDLADALSAWLAGAGR